ncbi:MAG: NADH-quinone oxidoreductase subunit N [Isosphaeraceae bacterium]|nr:NADH-quinone oxidoreductase subunit N [Isosphaeraceae bacterium]
MSLNALESSQQTLLVLLPELILLATATVMMTAGVFVRVPRRVWAGVSTVALFVSFVVLVLLIGKSTDALQSPVLNDALSVTGRLLFALSGFVILGLAHDQVDDARAPEFFGSLLFIHAGAMLTAGANELVFLFIGLELVSIPTYLLLYLSKRNNASLEASTKYFFLSIFASGLLLFGMAYLYGLAGVSNLKALSALLTLPNLPDVRFALIATLFIVAGLGFRVAAVPFHFYAPDVYQGSPTLLAGLLAWLPKGVGFFAMLRLLTGVLAATTPTTSLDNAIAITWIISAITMTLGNTVALSQNNLKRLFAYSSIAHAGYLMIGIVVSFRNASSVSALTLGAEGLIYYLSAYAFMTLGVFGVILALNTGDRAVETVDDLSGLRQSHPWLALAMAICLFSLAGIPPLAGFVGKFQLFTAAFSAARDEDGRLFRALAIIGAVNSAIGAYYYLRIIVGMYLKRPIGSRLETRIAWPTSAAIAVCTIVTILLGLFANPMLTASRVAAESVVKQAIPTTPAVASR